MTIQQFNDIAHFIYKMNHKIKLSFTLKGDERFVSEGLQESIDKRNSQIYFLYAHGHISEDEFEVFILSRNPYCIPEMKYNVNIKNRFKHENLSLSIH